MTYKPAEGKATNQFKTKISFYNKHFLGKMLLEIQAEFIYNAHLQFALQLLSVYY